MSSPYPSLCTDYTTLFRNKSLCSFLGPYTKWWAMLCQEVHGHFLYNFLQCTWFSNKAVNLNPFSRFGFSRTRSNSPLYTLWWSLSVQTVICRDGFVSPCALRPLAIMVATSLQYIQIRSCDTDHSCWQPSCSTHYVASWQSWLSCFAW